MKDMIENDINMIKWKTGDEMQFNPEKYTDAAMRSNRIISNGTIAGGAVSAQLEARQKELSQKADIMILVSYLPGLMISATTIY